MRSVGRVPFLTSLSLALIGVPCLAWGAQAVLLVSDLVIDVQLPAGGEHTTTFVVSNTGSQTEYARITYVDWWIDASNNHAFLEPGSIERTLYPYLTFSPASFRLGPGESQTVRVTVTVPSGGNGTYWGMLMIEGDAPTAETDEGGVLFQVHTRFGVKVYATLTGSEQVAGRVTRLHAIVTESGPQFTVEFENLGNARVTPSGWFEIRNVKGTTLWRSEFQGRAVLPQGTAVFTHPDEAPQLTPGQYLLLGIVDYGGERLVGGQSILTVE